MLTPLANHTRKLNNRYTPGEPKVLGTFQPTKNWEDTFAQRRIDVGKFYASKDNDYPTTTQGETRRINWGWAKTPPQSTQTLPREITFNARARVLQQAPIEELKQLRQDVAYVVLVFENSIVSLKSPEYHTLIPQEKHSKIDTQKY